jgi:4-hydroxythreonine-4-phosphate dehydrogenase
MKKKIIIITGDPNSINSEIIYKSWSKLNHSIKKRIYLISNYNLLKRQFQKLKFKNKLIVVENIYQKTDSTEFKIINVPLKFNNPFKIKFKENSKFIINSLNVAHKLGLSKNVAGIINCSIDKKLLKKTNCGVTEILASKSGIKDNSEVMLIGNNKMFVSPITTHIDLKNVSKRINVQLIVKKIKTINEWYRKKFKNKPKIAILGLNPHNGELKNSSEEKKFILPAIEKLLKIGIKIHGPKVADTIFINDYKKYNIIVGMYHDQVLSPFKAIFKFNAINITLGLKYIRTSPDHGTAKDLILKKKSNPISLLNCIKYINNFV